jgi:hypothetical protein
MQPDSYEKIESDKESTSASTKGEPQSSNQREEQQFSEYKELPFQQGLPLKEDNKMKIFDHDHEICMEILSDPTNQKANSTVLEDLNYDKFLSEWRRVKQ